MRLNDRILDAEHFRRRKATKDTLRKIAGWDIWECADPIFSYDYDRTVTLYVHHGEAVLTFADGKSVDLKPGDSLTIQAGARATWRILQPIKNSYMYHDSFRSAAERDAQVRWSSTDRSLGESSSI